MLQFNKGTFIITTANQTYTLDEEKMSYYNCKTKKYLQTAPRTITPLDCQAEENETDSFALFLQDVFYRDTCNGCYSPVKLLEWYRPYIFVLEKFFRIAYNHNHNIRYAKTYHLYNTLRTLSLQEYREKAVYKMWNEYLKKINYNGDADFEKLLRSFLNEYVAQKSIVWAKDIYSDIPDEWLKEHRYTLGDVQDRFSDKLDREVFLYYYYKQKGYMMSGFSYEICSYINKCRAMTKQPLKVNNFLRENGETTLAHKLWLEKLCNERIAIQVEKVKDKLFYEDDDFITIIPTTTQELVKEGNDMHHCVGSYGERVASGECYIVFIRKKKNPYECYLTAQVYPNGKIGQYYLAYDKTITEERDRQFRKDYEEHLFRAFNL